MEINWIKKGQIFVPDGRNIFKTHATKPIPVKINSKIIRIFFSSRTNEDIPLPTYIDVDIDNPSKIVYVNDKPLMPLGEAGTFDDSGITPTSILKIANDYYCYYVGWKRRRVNITFEPTIGICKIKNFDTKPSFERIYKGPILGQDIHNPILTAGPFVLNEQGIFKMWYCFGTEWRECETGPEPLYRIHYAESQDGFTNWRYINNPAIDYEYDGEVLSAPWVIKLDNYYLMWYSKRGSATKAHKNYSIGFAKSYDGLKWDRCDCDVGMDRANKGWDSEMQCYPGFLSHNNSTYMFYSGNNVGRDGIGYAVTKRFC